MNEEIILNMAQPYIKDSAMTYDEFNQIYYMLSRKEQYAVVEILFHNGIDLVDRQIKDEEVVLDAGEESAGADDFEVLYDESLFQDYEVRENRFDSLVVHHNIRQSNEILCSLVQQGNRQAMQDLCVKNKRLVDKYVVAYEKRYGNRLDFEDLEQVGFLGLIRAAKTFNASQGALFTTYVVYWIKQSISREIMDNGYAIRIPVHMIEKINKVDAADNRLESQGIPLHERIAQVAEELDLSEEKVRECIFLKNNYLAYCSLDAPVGDEEETVLGDFIPSEGEDSVEEIVISLSLRNALQAVLNTLTPRERSVLTLRYGLEDGRPRTLEEVGTLFNVTRERIRQIEVRAIRKLRHPSRSKYIKPFLEE